MRHVEQISNKQKAAILLISLGPEVAANVYKHLREDEIEQLTLEIATVRKVDSDDRTNILQEFHDLAIAEEYIAQGGIEYAKEVLQKALGSERALSILEKLTATLQVRPFEFARKANAAQILNFLQNEHPQTIAVILAHLEPEKKGEVLKRLPETLQAEVVLRLSNLDHVAPELIAEVDRVLKNELAALGTVEQASLGGVQPVAEMLNVMDKNTETSIMSRIEEKDPILAEEIRKLMFVFEDIVKIDDRGIQTLLKEIPNDKLLLALKTAPAEIKEKIFKNISQRAANLLKDDLSNMGPARLSDVEAAQVEIVNVARRLEGEGKILIARGSSEDSLV